MQLRVVEVGLDAGPEGWVVTGADGGDREGLLRGAGRSTS